MEPPELSTRIYCKQNKEKSGFRDYFGSKRDFRDLPLTCIEIVTLLALHKHGISHI